MSPAEIRMTDVIEASVASFAERFETGGVRVVTRLDGPGEMRGDAEKLRRVLINLLRNAVDALEESAVREPRIEIESGENLAGTEVWVRIHDNGAGIDPERLRHIWSPFYTSKSSGTGLGLAISKKLVEAHGGSIEASSEPGSGTEFLLTLPKHGTPEPRPALEETSS